MQLKINNFGEFDFTDEEVRQALSFSIIQINYLKNQYTQIAKQRLSAKLTEENTFSYSQEECFCQGQLDLLDRLINGIDLDFIKDSTSTLTPKD